MTGSVAQPVGSGAGCATSGFGTISDQRFDAVILRATGRDPGGAARSDAALPWVTAPRS